MYETLITIHNIIEQFADEATPASEPLTEAEHMVLACRTLIWAALSSITKDRIDLDSAAEDALSTD